MTLNKIDLKIIKKMGTLIIIKTTKGMRFMDKQRKNGMLVKVIVHIEKMVKGYAFVSL